MNIKQELRRILLNENKKNHKNDFGALMVFLDVEKKKWKELQDLINEDDLYTEENDSSYGREMDPHVTILYGLHDDIKDEDIEEDINEIKEPKIAFKSISSFNNDKFDVLKFDVKSEDLNKLNKKFSEYPNTNKFPDYHPHVTTCYVKAGKSEKYIKLLNDYLKENNLDITPNKIVYSKTNGTKKNYSFK